MIAERARRSRPAALFYVLLGLALILSACDVLTGRSLSRATGEISDTDGDGVVGSQDACPTEPGPGQPDGCPPPTAVASRDTPAPPATDTPTSPPTDTAALSPTDTPISAPSSTQAGPSTPSATSTNTPLPPHIVVEASCSDDGVATFVVSNTGGDMLVVYPYEVLTDDGHPAAAGGFRLTPGQTAPLTIRGYYGALTFYYTVGALRITAARTFCPEPTPTSTPTTTPTSTPAAPTNTSTPSMTPTAVPPKLSASGVCSPGGVTTFTVTNTGGDMTVQTEGSYIIRDQNGNTVQTGQFMLNSGASQQFSVQDVYGVLTIASYAGGGGAVSATVTCVAPTGTPMPAPPRLAVSASCTLNGVGTFVIRNEGGDMTGSGTWTATQDGQRIASNTFHLSAGQSTTIRTGQLYGTLELTVTGGGIARSASASTYCTPPTAAPTQTPTGTPQQTDTSTSTPTLTAVDTSTPTPTETRTRTPTPTPSDTARPTATPAPTNTPKPTPRDTSTPTNTHTPTYTPSPTRTKTPGGVQPQANTATPTPTLTSSTSTPTLRPLPGASATSVPPRVTVTSQPATDTATATQTAGPAITATSTATLTPHATATPSQAPVNIPTAAMTPTATAGTGAPQSRNAGWVLILISLIIAGLLVWANRQRP